VSGWVAVSYAGGPETRRAGSRPDSSINVEGTRSVLSRFLRLACHNSPGDYQGLGWSFPRGGKASVTERKGEDVHESEVAGPGRR
jgi:hypothetical protein